MARAEEFLRLCFLLIERVFHEVVRMDRLHPTFVGKNRILEIDLADFVMDLRSLAVVPLAAVVRVVS